MSIDKWIQHHKGDEPLFGLDRSKGINRNERNEELTEDALCLKIAMLTHQRDDARTQLAMVEAWHEQMCLSAERGWAQEAERTRERDDLRAWQVQIAEPLGYLVRAFGVGGYDVAEPSVIVKAWRELERERDEARAEVERLRAACVGSDLAEHYYRRGAEAMREACVATIHDGGLVWTRESAERALREIGIPEEPSTLKKSKPTP